MLTRNPWLAKRLSNDKGVTQRKILFEQAMKVRQVRRKVLNPHGAIHQRGHRYADRLWMAFTRGSFHPSFASRMAASREIVASSPKRTRCVSSCIPVSRAARFMS
ncbi:hypothetical protein COMA2_100136 [Candidatus Nitrospira nitrificans]|uniref:Uncharacterized protein n=1 Tax=Candidatus Nitrospira nitrificans TaxID=1742973 RepID=A0A0S4L9H9_9BACT|nr:hypothetical protein [Candidatus Nitrospira nitrificans]CUS32470.1 hypothetical protein COMA2_100136 [Candidatus Nitrospira nitrificans]